MVYPNCRACPDSPRPHHRQTRAPETCQRPPTPLPFARATGAAAKAGSLSWSPRRGLCRGRHFCPYPRRSYRSQPLPPCLATCRGGVLGFALLPWGFVFFLASRRRSAVAALPLVRGGWAAATCGVTAGRRLELSLSGLPPLDRRRPPCQSSPCLPVADERPYFAACPIPSRSSPALYPSPPSPPFLPFCLSTMCCGCHAAGGRSASHAGPSPRHAAPPMADGVVTRLPGMVGAASAVAAAG